MTREIHCLLTSGYSLGALALSRTAYELAVRSTVLEAFGREPGFEDLAEKYLTHEVVMNAKDAKSYQRHAKTLGYEPFEETFVAQLEEDAEGLLGKYGRNFKQQYLDKHPGGYRCHANTGVKFPETA